MGVSQRTCSSNGMGSVSQLPPELCDRIIDHTHDDVAALTACALTCRSWLPTARYHLFSETRIHAGKARSFDELVSTSPELGRAVSSLILFSQIYISSRWLSQPVSFLAHLPVVSRLTLSRIVAAMDLYTTLIEHLGTVKRLELSRVLFESYTDFAVFLRAFPLLQELVLDGIMLKGEEHGDMVGSPRLNLTSLRSLDIRLSMTLDVVTEFLVSYASHPSSANLRTLAYSIQHEEEVAPMQHMLHVLGPTLEHLRVTFNSDMQLNRMLGDTQLTLAPCTEVKTCVLSFYLREMCVPENQSLRCIPALLAQLASPHLQTISLSVHVDSMDDLRSLDSECAVRTLSCARFDDLRALDWESIERTLVQARFDRLRELEIHGLEDGSLLLSYIKDRFPDLSAREVVTLVPWTAECLQPGR